MRPNTVKQKWREGKIAVGGWLQMASSYGAELMANQGFDWLCIDTQHGAVDYKDTFAMLQAISTTDTVPFVRVPWSEPSIIMKYLDAGAYGIIIPMVSTRADAENAVQACRYPPDGIRSFGPNRVTYYAGDGYATEANSEIACIVMIETAEALMNLDDILSVPGVDAAYIGPSDLNQALGRNPRSNPFDPPHAEAVTRIREACERHGVVPGVHTWGNQIASRWATEGFKMIMLTSDVLSLSAGVRGELTALKQTIDGLEKEKSVV